MYFCILDRLDLFFYLPSYPIRLPSFFSARMVLESLVSPLSDRYRVNVTQSVVHVYMFISRFYWYELYIYVRGQTHSEKCGSFPLILSYFRESE